MIGIENLGSIYFFKGKRPQTIEYFMTGEQIKI
jgi:hypothetical protein